ncbi:MAG: hypothetical protein ABEJ65_04730 [bacterium]
MGPETLKLLLQVLGLLFGIPFLFTSIYFLKKGWDNYQRGQKLANMDFTDIQNGVDETVLIGGKADPLEPGNHVHSPDSEGKALYTKFMVYQHRGDNWHHLKTFNHGVPFVIEDSSGRCKVEPGSVEDFAGEQQEVKTKHEKPAPENIRSYVQNQELQSDSDYELLNQDELRMYRWETLKAGDQVKSLGQLQHNEGEGEPEFVMTDPGEDESLIVTTLSKDEYARSGTCSLAFYLLMSLLFFVAGFVSCMTVFMV